MPVPDGSFGWGQNYRAETPGTVSAKAKAGGQPEPKLRRSISGAGKKALECVSKIPEYAISGVAAPFLRHKARLSAAKPSGFFLELTQNPLELADFPF